MLTLALGGLLPTLAGPVSAVSIPQDHDILIRGAIIHDGTGSRPFVGDLAIDGDRIVAIGELDDRSGRREIAADGSIVAPGFIDLHSHTDRGLWRPGPQVALNVLTQGITTVVVGQDGRSAWPSGGSAASTIARWEGEGLTANVVLLIGFGSVRRAVLGLTDRPATAVERQRMRTRVREAMEQGALGISTGLGYVPDRFASTDELAAVIRAAGERGGIHISHLRDQGDRLLESVGELIEIAERTGATSVATHFKAVRRPNYGKSRAALALIREARTRGLRIYADQYPYTTSSNGIAVSFLPGRVRLELARDPSIRRLLRASLPDSLGPRISRELSAGRRDETSVSGSSSHRRLRELIRQRVDYLGGPDTYVVERISVPGLSGHTLTEVARALELPVEETAILLDLLDAQVTQFHIAELDLLEIMRQPFTATSSDGTAPRFGFGVVHPRSYGAFPRKLRHYAIDGEALSLEAAIRSMTALPAEILGLTDRGTLRPGQRADIVILDPDRIRDRATYARPHRHSEGVLHLLVNGVPVLEDGRFTGAFPGRVLTRSDVGSPPPPSPATR